jgi:hypothetical protein
MRFLPEAQDKSIPTRVVRHIGELVYSASISNAYGRIQDASQTTQKQS